MSPVLGCVRYSASGLQCLGYHLLELTDHLLGVFCTMDFWHRIHMDNCCGVCTALHRSMSSTERQISVQQNKAITFEFVYCSEFDYLQCSTRLFGTRHFLERRVRGIFLVFTHEIWRESLALSAIVVLRKQILHRNLLHLV